MQNATAAIVGALLAQTTPPTPPPLASALNLAHLAGQELSRGQVGGAGLGFGTVSGELEGDANSILEAIKRLEERNEREERGASKLSSRDIGRLDYEAQNSLLKSHRKDAKVPAVPMMIAKDSAGHYVINNITLKVSLAALAAICNWALPHSRQAKFNQTRRPLRHAATS